MKHSYIEDRAEEVLFFVCTYNGVTFQKFIYGSFENIKDAQRCVEKLKMTGTKRNIFIYEAKLIVHYEQE